MDTLYKGFLVDRAIATGDTHFTGGCTACHKGNDAEFDQEKAHQNLVRRPSDDPRTCGACHAKIAAAYRQALHYTTSGLRNGLLGRLAPQEVATFDQKVFGQSCRSCHAACGDCHVKSPVVGGLNLGLIDKHKFVRRNEGRTCGRCHGGRVYPEFTGEYGKSADVHHQKGMSCGDCHTAAELHGDGTAPRTRQEVTGKPACAACHQPGTEQDPRAKAAHAQHQDRVSCAACHASAGYRNCTGCHLGKGATSLPAVFLGRNPRDLKTITTLRLVPTVRDTFKAVGIRMDQFDALPNYWPSVPHNIRKVTDRTRDCGACHTQKTGFLEKATLIPNGSKRNEALVYTPQPLAK